MTVQITKSVRKATDADVPHLAGTLAASFYTDPVMSWCYPDDARRAEILPHNFRSVIEATLSLGGIDTVTDAVGAAVWIPPGTELDEERLADQIGRTSREYAERVFTLLALMDEHHPKDKEHQYLWLLGTRPEWQSQGIGSALMRPVLEACDRDGMPAYLEATSARNRDLYLRHGFEITEVLSLSEGPPLWCMWRSPRRSPEHS
ncbi:GNAT family N-acetyltransferase [Hoyosella subflava]|uniref:Acetyltransferase n=1 Tax=Hoyosella subflava (strain DSM 45089 / JCM 17490 / NBRC 109087 / DQS3-9A1) TaxID=443218 RepID=F6EQA7_HOYSD|nr:GNAT family N-acetyltransferase [Hoyosella subflava]AEF39530.1 Acetyltransferase [Hoyosella subflava DQS3-9A1]